MPRKRGRPSGVMTSIAKLEQVWNNLENNIDYLRLADDVAKVLGENAPSTEGIKNLLNPQFKRRVSRQLVEATAKVLDLTPLDLVDEEEWNGETTINKKLNPNSQKLMEIRFKSKFYETDLGEIQQWLKAIMERSHAYSLEIERIEQGSVVLFLRGTEEDFQRVEALFKVGELTEVLGVEIEDLQIKSATSYRDRLVKLWQWFEDQFTGDWQPQTLLPVAVRSKRLIEQEERVLGFKVFDLGSVSVTLVVSQTPEEEEAEIEVTLYPNTGQECLPAGIRFSLLDEFEQIIPVLDDHDKIIDYLDVTASEKETLIRLELVGNSGELFQVRLIFGIITVTEWFEI